MSEFLTPIISQIIELLKQYGFLSGCFIIILESMIPILPLGVFVAFNFSAFGIFLGFILSYVSTIIGCIIAYFLSNKMLGIYINKKTKEIYVNEPNTIPGSLAFYLWEPKGKEYPSLLDDMITLAIKEYKKKSKKTYSFDTNILSNYDGVKGMKGLKGMKGKLH